MRKEQHLNMLSKPMATATFQQDNRKTKEFCEHLSYGKTGFPVG